MKKETVFHYGISHLGKNQEEITLLEEKFSALSEEDKEILLAEVEENWEKSLPIKNSSIFLVFRKIEYKYLELSPVFI